MLQRIAGQARQIFRKLEPELGRDSADNMQGFESREETAVLAYEIDKCVHCVWCIFVGVTLAVHGAMGRNV